MEGACLRSKQPEIVWAEYPGRKCREIFTDDGLIDHSCELPEHHPGPPASKTSKLSIGRRTAWEAAHPGWEKLIAADDPFADATEKLKREG